MKTDARLLRWLPVGLALVAFAAQGISHAQEKLPGMHRVVIEVSGEGREAWAGVLMNAANLERAFGTQNTQIEVVGHGKGIGLLLVTDTALAAQMKRLSGSGVVFAACENTMRRKNLKKEDLAPFAVTVPSGIAEVVLKEEAGWSYVKGG